MGDNLNKIVFDSW